MNHEKKLHRIQTKTNQPKLQVDAVAIFIIKDICVQILHSCPCPQAQILATVKSPRVNLNTLKTVQAVLAHLTQLK
jgi:hypothetical protein